MRDSQVSRLLQWQEGKSPGPWLVNLFPTNRCNLQCPVCRLRGAPSAQRTKETPDERLLELVDECADAGAREWNISGGGEPLIRRDLVMALCERIRARGMNGVLVTNGILLTDEHMKHLIDIGWSRVSVSLEGATSEINDAVRGEGAFDAANARIRLFNEMKRRRGADKPVIGFLTVLTAKNYDKLDSLVDLASDMGCASGGIQLTTMQLYSEDAEPFQLRPEHKEALPEHLDRAWRRADELGVFNNLALFFRDDIMADPMAMRHRADPDAKGMLRALCYEPWLSVSIDSMGYAGPCCAFSATNADSINENSFREVWMGPYMQHVRERFLANRPLDYCARCPSNFFALRDSMAERLRLHQMGLPARTGFLLMKTKSSIQQYGFRRALRRGWEWLGTSRVKSLVRK